MVFLEIMFAVSTQSTTSVIPHKIAKRDKPLNAAKQNVRNFRCVLQGASTQIVLLFLGEMFAALRNQQ